MFRGLRQIPWLKPSTQRSFLPALLFLAWSSQASAFNLEPTSWPKGADVVMHLRLGTPPFSLQDGFPSWNATAADALAVWNGYLDFINISSVPGPAIVGLPNDGVNSVFFSNTVYGDSFGPNTLAITIVWPVAGKPGLTGEADVIVNTAIRYDSYRGPLQAYSGDLHRIFLHEFGHVLGLDHVLTGKGKAIMVPIISDLDHLGADDIAGVRELYGADFDEARPAVTIGQSIPFDLDPRTSNNSPISYSASGLPPGLALNNKSGHISGAATKGGIYHPVITAVGPVANAYTTFQITVGGYEQVPGLLAIVPWSGAYPVTDPIRPRLYASNVGTGVDMVDTETLAVKRLYSGPDCGGPVISADASTLYFTQPSAAGFQMKKIDLNTLKLLPTISLAEIRPSGNFVEGLDGRGYFGSAVGVTQFNLSSGASEGDFGYELGYLDNHELAISPDRKTLYASSITNGTFSYDISTSTPALLSSGPFLFDLHPGASGQYLYGVKLLPAGRIPARAFLPNVATSPTFGKAEPAGGIFVGQDEAIYNYYNRFPPASGSISVYDPVSLQETATINLEDLGVDVSPAGRVSSSYQLVDALPDGSGNYFFSVVIHRDDFGIDDELWKFSTDLASFPPPPTPPTKNLLNVSTRTMDRNGDASMIGGFIIKGADPKRVLVRAIGPSLPVTGAMDNPVLDLYDSSGKLLKSNDNWVTDRLNIIGTQLAPSSARESAILMTLPPGSYTAVVHDLREQPGLALVEVYDLASDYSLLANISTRGKVETGDNVMIGGFIIGGAHATKVIVRAIGPSLAKQGVPTPLSDPVLELYDGRGKLISTNDNWRSAQQADISAAGIAPSNDKESAILATLAPGHYTAIVRGQNGTTGVALVEIYNLDGGTGGSK